MFEFLPGSLEQRLFGRLDASGDAKQLLQELGPLAASGILGAAGAPLQDAATRMGNLVELAAAAIRAFAPHGWAPSGREPIDDYEEPLALLHGGDLGAAEGRLAEAWADWPWLTVAGRLSGFAAAHQPLNALFCQRSRLVRLATEHHLAGRYDASVPILLAQVEGLCIDVSGKQFFTRRGDLRADVVDDRTLAGLDEALPVARRWWEQSDRGTGNFGTPHRHAVLHGRELGYDTKVNSTKALVLLLAVIEWAAPIAAEKAVALRTARQATLAGSDEVDELGRRPDDREFTETRAALRWVQTCQFGRWNNRGRYLGQDLQAQLESGFVRHGLPSPSGVEVRCTPTGEAWWAWRKTVTGYVLGIGGVGPRPSEWLYEGPAEPLGPPATGPGWGDRQFTSTPNW